MTDNCRTFVLLLSASAVLSQEQHEEHNDELPPAAAAAATEYVGSKTIVTYLGTDFILPDGCPLPECDESRPSASRFCRRDFLNIKQKYDDCLA